MIASQATSTEHYKKLVNILGKTNVKSKIETPFDFITIAKKGVKAEIIKNFKYYFDLTQEDVAHLLNISEPTLYRWIKSNKPLDKNFSILLFELTDLFLFGISVFESKENFSKWLNISNVALGGYEPQEILELPGGISKIRDVLGRIEHGVFS